MDLQPGAGKDSRVVSVATSDLKHGAGVCPLKHKRKPSVEPGISEHFLDALDTFAKVRAETASHDVTLQAPVRRARFCLRQSRGLRFSCIKQSAIPYTAGASSY